LQLTLLVCPLGLGIGSEILQGLLDVSITHRPKTVTQHILIAHLIQNGREFDPYDILANILGSLAAIGLSTWYHKRMLDRKRAARSYHTVPGDDEHDLELGEGTGGLETGVTRDEPTLEEEVENWDENAWDEEETGDAQQDDDQETTQNGGADTHGKKNTRND